MKKKKIMLITLTIVVAILILLLAYLGFIKFIGATTLADDENTYMFKDEFPVTKLEEIDYLLQGFLGPRPFNLHLRTDPREADTIPSEDDIRTKTLKSTKVIYVTVDPDLTSDATIAAAEITKITGAPEIMNIPTFVALTEKRREDIPKKTCEDNTESERVILLKLAKETNIHSEDTCIIIEGTNELELIKASDKFILQLLGIV